MAKTNLEIGGELVKYGKSLGASDVQVSVGSGERFSVDVRDGKVENLVQAGSMGLSLKVVMDGKVATASSSDMRPETLKKLMDGAVERAKYAGKDDFAELPDPEGEIVNAEKLNLYDPEFDSYTAEQKIKLAKEVERLALAEGKIKKSGGAGASSSINETTLVTSRGFAGSYKSSYFSYGVSLQAGEGDNLYDDGRWTSARRMKDLESPEKIAKEAVERTARMIGARKIATQNVPVVFEPEMSAMLLGFLASCIYGSSVYMNRSFLAGKLGEKIAGENVTIIDDPLMPGALGSRPFDGEGIASRRNAIIERGVLKNYALNNYAAKKLSLKVNGMGSGTSNYYLESGKLSQAEIIKSVDKGLLLINTIGQGEVPTSGDISKGAYGMWIENGEIVYPVAEITFSGNLGKILNSIEMIGNDPDKTSSTYAPTIKVAELTLSGK